MADLAARRPRDRGRRPRPPAHRALGVGPPPRRVAAVLHLATPPGQRHGPRARGRVAGTPASPLAVCFVDIVGYTSRAKFLDEAELVGWLEHFENAATGLVVDHGGRIIKTIGDEVLFVADRASDAAEIALLMTERGSDGDDPFPDVRAGHAHGNVVSRLGDVFGPTVNIAPG